MEASVVPSQLTELGQQALTDVRIGVANGEPLVRCQLLASEFYEALKRGWRHRTAARRAPISPAAVPRHCGDRFATSSLFPTRQGSSPATTISRAAASRSGKA